MGKRNRTRRKRRTLRQVLKHGRSAKRKHARVGGRTGSIHTRKLRSRGAQ